MTYFAKIIDVPAPIGLYDATHAEGLSRTGGQIDGLVVHVCRPTEGGFQLLEVWTDKESCERAEREILAPILAEAQGDGPPDASSVSPSSEVFEVRGLIVPGARIAS